MNPLDEMLAPPCGLYCGICPDFGGGQCPGCTVQKPAEADCDIIKCVSGRHLETCAACPDLPCTLLIQFTVDPVWRTHLPCIENLRRQKKIGPESWLKEQAELWKDDKRRNRWRALSEECGRKRQKELRVGRKK